VYALELLLLGYFLYGATTGNLAMFGRRSLVVVTGIQAWIACLMPVFMLAWAYFNHDPSLRMAGRVRNRLATACMATGLDCGLAAVFG
jgi:hypothetical protein